MTLHAGLDNLIRNLIIKLICCFTKSLTPPSMSITSLIDVSDFYTLTLNYEISSSTLFSNKIIDLGIKTEVRSTYALDNLVYLYNKLFIQLLPLLRIELWNKFKWQMMIKTVRSVNILSFILMIQDIKIISNLFVSIKTFLFKR